MNQTVLWDAFSADYDRFVNWEQRLGRELPFLEDVLAEDGARSVLDVACGTGHHAIALALRGYEVAGVDVSREMIRKARENAEGAGVAVDFRVAGFGALSETMAGQYDALLCLGNSLPSIPEGVGLGAALEDMARVLRPGGVLVTQSLNYDHLWPQQQRFLPLEIHRQGPEEWLFFRFVDFHPETLTFNVVVFHGDGGTWNYWTEATELRPIFSQDLNALLDHVGFGEVRLYGDYFGNPYKQASSGDLIVVARRV